LLSFFLPAAALGVSAFVAIIVGFAAQRFLRDGIAGGLSALERWYAVGDFVMIEPSKAAGIVEQFGLRTTVLRALNGDRAYVPNSQIITAFWSPRGYRRYSIELLTNDPDEARRAIEDVGRRGPAGQARFLRRRESSRCESWRTRAGSSAESSTSLRRWNGSPRICSSVRSRRICTASCRWPSRSSTRSTR